MSNSEEIQNLLAPLTQIDGPVHHHLLVEISNGEAFAQ
jgi:hypothetical protein